MKRGTISRRAIKRHLEGAGFKRATSMDSFPGVDVFRHVVPEEGDTVTVTLGALDRKTGDFSCCVHVDGDVVDEHTTLVHMEVWLAAPTKMELLYLFDDIWRMSFYSLGMRFEVLYNWGYHKKWRLAPSR